jgi:hypothetical protein
MAASLNSRCVIAKASVGKAPVTRKQRQRPWRNNLSLCSGSGLGNPTSSLLATQPLSLATQPLSLLAAARQSSDQCKILETNTVETFNGFVSRILKLILEPKLSWPLN